MRDRFSRLAHSSLWIATASPNPVAAVDGAGRLRVRFVPRSTLPPKRLERVLRLAILHILANAAICVRTLAGRGQSGALA